MKYAEWLALDGNLQVDVLERVLNRIMYIPGINVGHNSDLNSDDVDDPDEIVIAMVGDEDAITKANAQCLRNFLTINNVKHRSDNVRSVIFSKEDLFTLFSDE
jgi:hypothetical protein